MTMATTKEIRVVAGAEMRADAEKRVLTGISPVYEKLSEDLGGFREKIARGAAAESVRGDDIRALFSHDSARVLGRTRNKTLRLSEGDGGVEYEIDVPRTSYGDDLLALVDRGDINAASFGFEALDERWETLDGEPLRWVMRMRLLEISPVAFPAYPDTTVARRSLEGWRGEPVAGLVEARRRLDLHELSAAEALTPDIR